MGEFIQSLMGCHLDLREGTPDLRQKDSYFFKLFQKFGVWQSDKEKIQPHSVVIRSTMVC